LVYNEETARSSKSTGGSTWNKFRTKSIPKDTKTPDAIVFDILNKWQKPLEQHSVFLDLPKIVNNCNWFDHDLHPLSMEEMLRRSRGSSDDIEDTSESGTATVRKIKVMLMTLASIFREDTISTNVEKYYSEEVKAGQDLSTQLKKFFTKHIDSDSKTVTLLKLLSHSTLATPYLMLKEKFNEIGFPIKDISGSWNLQVVFRHAEIHVVHEKKACGSSDAPDDQFDFVWHLQAVLDKQVTTLKNAQLSLTDLNINSTMLEDKKKKIRSIISLFLL
jgi:hypothetical protein